MLDWLIAGRLEEAYERGKHEGYIEGWVAWAQLASDSSYCENPHCLKIKAERREDRREGHQEGYRAACEDVQEILFHGTHTQYYIGADPWTVGECDCGLCKILDEYKERIEAAVGHRH